MNRMATSGFRDHSPLKHNHTSNSVLPSKALYDTAGNYIETHLVLPIRAFLAINYNLLSVRHLNRIIVSPFRMLMNP